MLNIKKFIATAGLATLILSGCGYEIRKIERDNPKADSQLEQKVQKAEVKYKSSIPENAQERILRYWDNGKPASAFCYIQKGPDWESAGARDWYESGQIARECPSLGNKLKHGTERRWYENGQLKEESTYRNGKLEGESRSWYENGQLKELGFFKNGGTEGIIKSWHTNGQLKATIVTKNGKEEGEAKQWYETGQLAISVFFKNGERDGSYKVWHKDGKLWIDMTFKHDCLNGLTRIWRKDGKIKLEKEYEYKRIVSNLGHEEDGELITVPIIKEWLENTEQIFGD